MPEDVEFLYILIKHFVSIVIWWGGWQSWQVFAAKSGCWCSLARKRIWEWSARDAHYCCVNQLLLFGQNVKIWLSSNVGLLAAVEGVEGGRWGNPGKPSCDHFQWLAHAIPCVLDCVLQIQCVLARYTQVGLDHFQRSLTVGEYPSLEPPANPCLLFSSARHHLVKVELGHHYLVKVTQPPSHCLLRVSSSPSPTPPDEKWAHHNQHLLKV